MVIYDDNRDVIQILDKMLKSIGLTSFAATESKAIYPILEKLGKRNDKPNLFILDLTIPGDRGGAELIGDLRKDYPDSYFIVSSGYSDNFVLSEYEKYGFDNLLKNPYSFYDLKSVLIEYTGNNSATK